MQISKKIVYYLPKNTSEKQLTSLAGDDFYTRFINHRNSWGAVIVKTAYFWPLVFKWSKGGTIILSTN